MQINGNQVMPGLVSELNEKMIPNYDIQPIRELPSFGVPGHGDQGKSF